MAEAVAKSRVGVGGGGGRIPPAKRGWSTADGKTTIVPVKAMLEQFRPLIQTKLSPPRTSAQLVRRDRLLASLDSGRERRVTLLVGPAGCGKTLLAAAWRQQLIAQGGDVVWFAANTEDDAPLFCAYLAAALEGLGLPLAPESPGVLSRFGDKSIDRFVNSLVNSLYDHPRPVTLFVDDYHSLDSPQMGQMLGRLLKLAPDSFHLVLLSRSNPSLDLVDLRVRGQVTVIGFSDLRFDVGESREFLSRQSLAPLTSTEVRTIHSLTDGWAAGLQVVAYALRKSHRRDNMENILLPNQAGLLGDYLERCVVANLSREELAFLVRTSTCRRFNAQLCEVITGNSEAGELLRKFAEDGLFVLPIESDDPDPWYRFHRLFSKFLRRRLVDLPGAEIAALNRKASDWFAAGGHCVEAVRHALFAKDVDACFGLVERFARGMIERGEFLLVLKWLAALPADRLAERLELLLCAGWAQLASGQLDGFRATLTAIEAHREAQGRRVRLEICLLKGWYRIRSDDSAAVLALFSAETPAPPRDDPFLADVLHNVLAWGKIQGGQFAEARDLLRGGDGHPGCESSLTSGACAGRAFLGLSFFKEGDLRQAKSTLQKAMVAAQGVAVHGLELMGLSVGLLAGTLYGLDEISAARSLIDDYGDLVELIAAADDLIILHLVRARLLKLDGDDEAALAVLDRLEQCGRRLGLDRPVAWSLAERVAWEAPRHNFPAAREAFRRLRALSGRYGAQPTSALAEIPILAQSAEAELAAATNQEPRAVELLQAAIAAWQAMGRQGEVVLLRLRSALIRSRMNDLDGALDDLASAVSVAAQLGLVRVFLDQPPAIGDLLAEFRRRLSPAAPERDFVDDLLLRLGGVPVSPIASAEVAADMPLSPRELEILVMLSQAYSNKSVARALNCSTNTVKWHLKNIFGKLAASSREDAVVKGRKLKLLNI